MAPALVPRKQVDGGFLPSEMKPDQATNNLASSTIIGNMSASVSDADLLTHFQ